MRKLEGIVKEIVEELDYLKKREERFSSTNGTPLTLYGLAITSCIFQSQRINGYKPSVSSLSSHWWAWEYGKFSISDHISNESISSISWVCKLYHERYPMHARTAFL